MSFINLNEARILITNDDGISAEGIKILISILENYQNEDGTIQVPDALIPYMGLSLIHI